MQRVVFLDGVGDLVEAARATEDAHLLFDVGIGVESSGFQVAFADEPAAFAATNAFDFDGTDKHRVLHEVESLGGMKLFADGSPIGRIEPLLDGQQLVVVFFGLLVASVDQGVDGFGCEAEHSKARDVGHDADVAKLAVLLAFGARGVDEQATHHLGQRLQVVGRDAFLACHLNADDDVGSHLLEHVGGEIVDQAAVDEDAVAHLDRGKHAWDGHAGTHGRRHDAMTQNDFLPGDEVGGHTSERNRHVVEVHLFLVAHAKVVEQVDQRAVVDVGTRQLAEQVAFFGLLAKRAVAKRDVEHVGASPFAHVLGEVGAVDFVADHFVPLDVRNESRHLVGFVAHGVEAADDGAHAGARHIIDGDAHVLDVFQDPDVGSALGTATT